MNFRRHRIISSFVFFVVAIFGFIFSTYAWLDYTHRINNDIVGAAKVGLRSYFGGGTGSSSTPFIISEKEHFYNLAILQNLGYLQSQTYYFKVVPINTQVKYIDFSTYHNIPPVGSHTYPFIGIFDGDYSNLKYLTIDGSGLQDIGVFGNIGTGGQVKNLFLEEPEIISNPLSSLDMTNFHVHNNSIKNIATGYIVGHLAAPPNESFVSLSDVFVIAPKITSLSNNNKNRSQFGLIGFNASDLGVITGGPRDAYNFSLNAADAYISIAYTRRDIGHWIVLGTSNRLDQVITGTTITGGVITGSISILVGYSLSTMKVYDPAVGSGSAVFLYDKMVSLGYAIESIATNTKYSRDNVDIIGSNSAMITSTLFEYRTDFPVSAIPVGNVFNPVNYINATILYVKPPRDSTGYLGKIKINNISGGGDLGLFGAFIQSGSTFTYDPTKYWKNKNSISLFITSGFSSLYVNHAFAAVTKNPTTGVMTVVNPSVTTPDFYVILIGLGNGQASIDELSFEFIPSVLTQDVLQSVEDIDFINSITDLPTIEAITNHTFSMFNFGYDLTANQKLDVLTVRQTDGSFNVYLDYSITDYSTFYFDIININNYSVKLYINGSTTPTYTSNNDVIEAIFTRTTSGSTVTYKAYNTTS